MAVYKKRDRIQQLMDASIGYPKTVTTLPTPTEALAKAKQTYRLVGAFAADVSYVDVTCVMINGAPSWTGHVYSANAPSDSDTLPNGVVWEQIY